MAGFQRNYTPQYGGVFKTPAGKTTASAGAGGASPRAQAPGVMPRDDQPVDLSGLGGLLYWMGQAPEGSIRMDMISDPTKTREATPDKVTAGIASMTPEERAAADASPFKVDYGLHLERPVFTDTRTGEVVADPRKGPDMAGTNGPTYYDRQGNVVPGPDASWWDRLLYNVGKWF
jgi:hypothetical protein